MVDVKGSRRKQSARETRRQVLAAAAELFVARGYVATTIEQVAAAAGVSRPTVFAVGSSKAQLFALARDVAMAGDDDAAPVSQRESVQRVLAAEDPPELLALLAEHVVGVQERYGPLDEVLHRGAGADPELAALWHRAEEQRRQGASLLVDALAARSALAVTSEEAVDTLWLLMAPDVHTRLVRDRGWPRDRYATWLERTLRVLLLPAYG